MLDLPGLRGLWAVQDNPDQTDRQDHLDPMVLRDQLVYQDHKVLRVQQDQQVTTVPLVLRAPWVSLVHRAPVVAQALQGSQEQMEIPDPLVLRELQDHKDHRDNKDHKVLQDHRVVLELVERRDSPVHLELRGPQVCLGRVGAQGPPEVQVRLVLSVLMD